MDTPSDAILSNRGLGDDDMEPSTKTLAMLELLKERGSAGDKKIVYSHTCPPPFLRVLGSD